MIAVGKWSSVNAWWSSTVMEYERPELIDIDVTVFTAGSPNNYQCNSHVCCSWYCISKTLCLECIGLPKEKNAGKWKWRKLWQTRNNELEQFSLTEKRWLQKLVHSTNCDLLIDWLITCDVDCVNTFFLWLLQFTGGCVGRLALQ